MGNSKLLKCCDLSRSPPLAQVALGTLGISQASFFIVCPPPAQVVLGVLRAVPICRDFLSPPAEVVLGSLGVTFVSLFIVFPSLPRWCSALSELPECHYLSCFPVARSAPSELPKCRYFRVPPCPGAAGRPRSYQSVAIYRVSPPPRWCIYRVPATAIFRVPLLPRWGSPPSKSPNCCDLLCCPLAPVGLPALDVTNVSLFIVFTPRPQSYQSVVVYHVSPAQVGFPTLEVTKVFINIVPPLLR